MSTAGCSRLEFSRVVLGVGLASFRENGKIYSESFTKPLARCYEETQALFKENHATVYKGNLKRRFIVAVHFHTWFEGRCVDTTEVAVFFKETAEGATVVEVSSLNYALSEFVSLKLFERLHG